MLDPALIARFRADLDGVVSADAKLGIAVSGGADSLALLLLARAACPGRIEAATVDHALRPDSRGEAELVGEFCAELGVPHAILTAQWGSKPATALQERARTERYRLLAGWIEQRGFDALATAHHLDDQVETLLMRLARGAGVRGLAGMRAIAAIPGSDLPLVRPLLGWRRSELSAICEPAGITPVNDPSNADDRFERVRVRSALAEADWLQAEGVAQSAVHLASADEALRWATDVEWDRQVSRSECVITYRPSAPDEIRRRVVASCIDELAAEGGLNPLRGRELDRVIEELSRGRKATLRGVLCTGGGEWRFEPAPPRHGVAEQPEGGDER